MIPAFFDSERYYFESISISPADRSNGTTPMNQLVEKHDVLIAFIFCECLDEESCIKWEICRLEQSLGENIHFETSMESPFGALEAASLSYVRKQKKRFC